MNFIFKINPLGSLLAILANMILGALWYSVLFGKAWMKAMGYKKEDLSGQNKAMLLAIVTAVIYALALNFIVANIGVDTIFKAVILAVIVWVGFIVPYALLGVAYEQRKMKVFLISTGYQGAGLVIMSILIVMV